MRPASVIALALVLAFTSVPLGISPAAAAGTTTIYLPNITKMLGGPDGWQTPFIVQNVGGSVTSVNMQFYSFGDGSLVKTRTVPALTPGTSVFHDPNSDPDLPAGGQFAVVVESSGSQISAVVNEHQNVRNQSRQEALSYGGLTTGSTRVFLPYVAKQVGGWLTTLIVQNLGTGTANVSAQFIGSAGGSPVTLTRSMAPGRSQFVDPRVENSLAAGAEFAVSLSSDQPIGVVVNAHNDDAGAPAPMGFSYNGVPADSNVDAWVPYVARNTDGIGRSTRLLIQNIGVSAATPSLVFRRFGSPTAVRIDGPVIAAGAARAFETRGSTQLNDGEYGVHVIGGQFAIVAVTTSPTTAMGYTNTAGNATRLFLPNVTRNLGGSSGWTTPIIIQGRGTRTTSATLSWYRFSDGLLVHRQLLLGIGFGVSLRVDPRSLPQLADDTQYAVVVEAPFSGVSAIVTELNLQGGDGGMVYEGFPPPPAASFGTSNCDPASAPAGTSFVCKFYGLPPGARPSTFTFTLPPGMPTASTTDEPVAADGTLHLTTLLSTPGTRTITASAGGVSKTVSVTATAPTFSVTITRSIYGQILAVTTPGIACTADARLPSGSFSTASGLEVTKVADGSGGVAWTYDTSAPTTPGTGTHFARCTLGSQTLFASAAFTVP
jgi:hypothetical protein